MHHDIAQYPRAIVKRFCATIFRGFSAMFAAPLLPSLPCILALLQIARTAIVPCDDARRFLFFCDTNDVRVVTLFAKSRCDPLSIHTTCVCTHADFTRPRNSKKKAIMILFLFHFFFRFSPPLVLFDTHTHTPIKGPGSMHTHARAHAREKRGLLLNSALLSYTYIHTHIRTKTGLM